MSNQLDLYQQVILEHNRKPRNFKKLDPCTHSAEGLNPLCGDHLYIYLNINNEEKIESVSFEGSGCAISKASASMMTTALVGKSCEEADVLFNQFKKLLHGEIDPQTEDNVLGKLKIFSGIWQYPARVKCAALAWHAMNNALNQNTETAKTE
ncbi:MAG: SUF system NifU family Fe-S cluster assembly protein [Bdellovibrionota bacterium]